MFWNQAGKILGPFIFLFLVCPLVYQIEVWGLQKIREKFPNSSTARRIAPVSLELLRNPQVHLVRLNLPGEVLRYQRVLASGRTLPSHFEGNVGMLAVSRNAKGILERHTLNYVDPLSLPAHLRARLPLPFSRDALPRYLLIREF